MPTSKTYQKWVDWLLKLRLGEPSLLTGETLHDWTFVEAEFVSDSRGNTLKLRKVVCEHCKQEWIHE